MNTQHRTENLTIHHKVKDYAEWRIVYDGHEKSRVLAGITNGRVFRSAEDPNDLVILQDVADVDHFAERLISVDRVDEGRGLLELPRNRGPARSCRRTSGAGAAAEAIGAH